jgi:glycosyltransferase involved in cell wall biosynthesis
VPVLNGERFLGDCLDSILDDLECSSVTFDVIVVDDGSDDRTAEIATGYASRGVRLFRQPNLGSALARNAGIALTKSRWVTMFDADDLWPPGRTEALTRPLRDDPDLDAVFGWSMEFDDGAPDGSRIVTEPQAARMATTGVIRRETFERYGSFRRGRLDIFEWSTRVISAGLQYVSVDALVLRRRIHQDNISHDFGEHQNQERLRVLRAALTARALGQSSTAS